MPAAELLRRALRAAGVDACYGEPFGALPVTAVPAGLAGLFAEAHGRVTGRPAAALAGGRLLLPGPPGPATAVSVADPAELVELVVARRTAPVEARLELDAAAPGPDRLPDPPPADGWTEPDPAAVERLCAAAAPVVLAGPDVVRRRAVAGLHDLAVAGSLGVLNTWGAKGVFHWRSRHHLATVGLQADDYRLGGLAGADLVVATGVDEREAGGDRWRLAPVVTVDPAALAPLAEAIAGGRPPGPVAVPPLRPALAAVTQAGWARPGAPLAPTRVTRAYGEAVGPAGLVAADPGTAGYWVARTFPTAGLGGAVVPAGPDRGLAVVAAAVAARCQPGRPALAVVDGPPAAGVVAALEAVAALGLRVAVEVWDPGGPALDADAHARRLRRLLLAGGTETLATDGGQLAEMEAVAGPVVAWPDLRGSGTPA